MNPQDSVLKVTKSKIPLHITPKRLDSCLPWTETLGFQGIHQPEVVDSYPFLLTSFHDNQQN